MTARQSYIASPSVAAFWVTPYIAVYLIALSLLYKGNKITICQKCAAGGSLRSDAPAALLCLSSTFTCHGTLATHRMQAFSRTLSALGLYFPTYFPS